MIVMTNIGTNWSVIVTFTEVIKSLNSLNWYVNQMIHGLTRTPIDNVVMIKKND